MRESNAKDALFEREADDHERSHISVFQVQRQLLKPPGREFLQSIGDETRTPGEEMAGLGNRFLARGSRLNQFSGGRQDGRRDFLFESTGEQLPLNALGGTQIGNLCFCHGRHLMIGRRIRYRALAGSHGFPASEGENSGNEVVFIATCLATILLPLAIILAPLVHPLFSAPYLPSSANRRSSRAMCLASSGFM